MNDLNPNISDYLRQRNLLLYAAVVHVKLADRVGSWKLPSCLTVLHSSDKQFMLYIHKMLHVRGYKQLS